MSDSNSMRRYRLYVEDTCCQMFNEEKVVVLERETPFRVGEKIEVWKDCNSRYGSGGAFCQDECRGNLGFTVLKILGEVD